MYSKNKKIIKQKNKKKESKFFEIYINRFGENFMNAISSYPNVVRLKMDMKKNLVRDIAYGNIDIIKYGRYFTPQFNLFLIEAVTEEYRKRRLFFKVFSEYCFMNPLDNEAKSYFKEINEGFRIYRIIYDNIYKLNLTGDLNYITIIPNNIKYLSKSNI